MVAQMRMTLSQRHGELLAAAAPLPLQQTEPACASLAVDPALCCDSGRPRHRAAA
jgi:hypothetical protein